MNPQMFNSFLDGTKSAIEMGAVANATGLLPPADGLAFPPCDVDELPEVLKPRAAGGVLAASGQVEVIASLARDGTPLARDLRWGVYCVFRAPDEYVRRCFAEYGLKTDASGWYSAMYKPYHLIGLELGISVATVALRGEPTGQATAWRADVVATAKRDLRAGEYLDGEGGYTVWGKLVPAARSRALGALPLGLAHGCRIRRDIAAGAVLGWDDVDLDPAQESVRVRREMEAAFPTETDDHAGGQRRFDLRRDRHVRLENRTPSYRRCERHGASYGAALSTRAERVVALQCANRAGDADPAAARGHAARVRSSSTSRAKPTSKRCSPVRSNNSVDGRGVQQCRRRRRHRPLTRPPSRPGSTSTCSPRASSSA